MNKSTDLLVAALENEGVDHIFGVPGEENLDVVKSFRTSSIEFVPTRHEQAAAFMAATRGRLTGTPGVCISTLEPGAPNLTTGATSRRDWDLLAAQRAGALGIGLLSGGYGREELERSGAVPRLRRPGRDADPAGGGRRPAYPLTVGSDRGGCVAGCSTCRSRLGEGACRRETEALNLPQPWRHGRCLQRAARHHRGAREDEPGPSKGAGAAEGSSSSRRR